MRADEGLATGGSVEGGQPFLAGVGVALVVGVLLRLAALALHPPLDIDETRYLITAYHQAGGMGYSDWHGPEIDILPMQPWLIALLGQDPETLEFRGRAVACGAAILGLCGFAFLARTVSGHRAAVVATWLVALHPWLVRAAGRPQPETLYVLFTVIALLAIAPVMAGGSVRGVIPWGASGLFFGLAYLTRPEGFLVAVSACALAAWQQRPHGRAAWSGPILFALILLLLLLPYFIWLRQMTGVWTLTGKADEIFFIGQAMHAHGGALPSAAAYLALQREYGSIFGFAAAHPVDLLAGAARFATILFAWILPRGLGPLGLLGLVLAMWSLVRSPTDRGIPLWPTLPALVLPIMTLTFPNEKVAATAIPFLLIPASVGLTRRWSMMPRRGPGGRRVALAAAMILALSPWLPPALRAARRQSLAPQQTEREAVAQVTRVGVPAESIVSNSPVVSFYARDPLLFGPPGLYRPLEPGRDCARLVALMRQRLSHVAILQVQAPAVEPADMDPNCRLSRTNVILERGTGRRFEVWREGV